jgi:hypothetical protein
LQPFDRQRKPERRPPEDAEEKNAQENGNHGDLFQNFRGILMLS